MTMTQTKKLLEARREELKRELIPYEKLKAELADVETALRSLEPKQTCPGCHGCDECRLGRWYR